MSLFVLPMIALIILAGGFFIIKNIQSENEIFDPQKYYENKVDLLSDKTPLKTTKLATIQVPLDQTTDSELRILFGPNGNKVLYDKLFDFSIKNKISHIIIGGDICPHIRMGLNEGINLQREFIEKKCEN